MHKVDLDSMSEEQLRTLNREIVRRLEYFSAMRHKSQLMAFRVGDRVAFDSERGPVTGIVVRINQKTASIEGDDGRGWRVSPHFLQKVVDAKEMQPNLFPVPNPRNA